jgi:hypothetical protein
MKLRTNMMYLFEITYTNTESLFDKCNQKTVKIISYSLDSAMEMIRAEERAHLLFCQTISRIDFIDDSLIHDLFQLRDIEKQYRI